MSEMRIARVFNAHDFTGRAVMDPYQPRLAQTERARVVEYLENGKIVLSTTGRDTDQVNPDRGEVVPMNFLTDGDWVWSEALPYYVAMYGYAPEPEFLDHMKARNYRLPPSVSDDRIRAASAKVLGR